MDDRRWRITLGVGLVALSAVLYFVHYLIFHDAHHIFIYMVGDIAFVPIEVLLVTMILHELLTRREKRATLHKLNMVIGAFFSEVGTRGLAELAAFDPDAEEVSALLRPDTDWTGAEFARAGRAALASTENVDAGRADLSSLKDFLVERRGFLLRLLENPNLLEHEAFTDLLWATLHLTEELENRADLTSLPASDLAHLSGDIRRAYAALIGEWISYMKHLSSAYPYLYSLAIRTNPFDPHARVEVA
jgi:hypothetical protein